MAQTLEEQCAERRAWRRRKDRVRYQARIRNTSTVKKREQLAQERAMYDDDEDVTPTRQVRLPSNTKYDEKRIIEMLGFFDEGCSVTEVAARMGVHRDTLYHWAKKYPDFKTAMQYGRQLSEAYYLETGRKIMMGEMSGNPTLVIWMMKALFGYSDQGSAADPLAKDDSININVFPSGNKGDTLDGS